MKQTLTILVAGLLVAFLVLAPGAALARIDLVHDASVKQSSSYTGKVAAGFGTSIDLGVGNPYGGALFILNVGAYADSANSGKYVFALQESDNDTTFTSVPASRTIGTLPTLTDSADGSQVYQVQVIRNKRYVRPAWTVVGASSDTTACPFTILFVKIDPKYRPAQ